MRFGICTTPDLVPTLARAGYDYAELPVVRSLQPERPEQEVMPDLTSQLGHAAIAPEVWYLFLPGDLRVVGDHVEVQRLEEYLQQACARAARLGARVMAFGSGAARQIPAGFSRAEARRQMVQALVRAGQAAAPYNLTVALESLNTAACNHINSVSEAAEYVREAAHPALGVLADLHHMTQDNQPSEDTLHAGRLLAHVHVAGAGRRAPTAEDIPYLTDFFQKLKRLEYTGRVSIEGNWNGLLAEASDALEAMHRAWERA